MDISRETNPGLITNKEQNTLRKYQWSVLIYKNINRGSYSSLNSLS